MTEAGDTVLHHHFGWPGTEERLPAGSYVG